MTNLTKRKKAERRFQFYGIFAVGLSLLFVLVLILNIFFAGIGGFFKTSFIIPFHFDQNLLKIDENWFWQPRSTFGGQISKISGLPKMIDF